MPGLMPWAADPGPALETVFAAVAAGPMAGLPLLNPALRVEAVAFRRGPEGQWVGALVTPWAINLLCLPGDASTWPAAPAGAKHDWRFPSGAYEFIVAEMDRLGPYHLCSLFSPALEFATHEEARLTALAAMEALLRGAADGPDAPRPAPTRRAFLGLAP